jgi:uncharacterized membrane protein YidH (DUF202 family)
VVVFISQFQMDLAQTVYQDFMILVHTVSHAQVNAQHVLLILLAILPAHLAINIHQPMQWQIVSFHIT